MSHASSIRRAALEANRLHRDLSIQSRVIRGSGRVDVYDTIARLDVSLFFTKLDGLLGVYLREPSPGVLVTTQRPKNQQRFTAAHELGHHYLGHHPSLDDESILLRSPFQARADDDPQEVEAEAFAAVFLLPRWLLDWHCEKQDWTDADLLDPIKVYQLALRVGTSFKATVWTLHRYDVFDLSIAVEMAELKLKNVKKAILRGYEPANYYGDVWLITDRDEGIYIEGSPRDLMVVCLPERSGSGYLWRIESADGEAVAIVADDREQLNAAGVGGPTLRRITAAARARSAGELHFAEIRPWAAAKPIKTFFVGYDLSGSSQQGWYEPQRRAHMQAAA